MVDRGLNREAFGKKLINLGKNIEVISRARIEIEAMRLMVLRAAKAMDTLGNAEARVWVSAVKAMVPGEVLRDHRRGHPDARRRRHLAVDPAGRHVARPAHAAPGRRPRRGPPPRGRRGPRSRTASRSGWPVSPTATTVGVRSSPARDPDRAREPGTMLTVYEAAGGDDGLLRLAGAWHARVLADDVVAHAFSHGYHPQHTERLAAYWAEALGGPATYSDLYGDETSVVRMHSGNGTARGDGPAGDRLLRPGAGRRRSRAATSACARCCTSTSPGRPRPPCPGTTGRPTTCRRVCASRAGRGTGSSRDRTRTTLEGVARRVVRRRRP